MNFNHLIVGLGNPGKKYENTRHNIGFMVVEALAKKIFQGEPSWKEAKKFKALVCEGPNYLLAKPQTYMNNSGEAIKNILSFYKLLSGRAEEDLTALLTVIHDDLDIALGKYKISLSSRSAGHNGVESIIINLKTKKFRRFRIGIGAAEKELRPAEKFVLEKFSRPETAIIKKVILEVVEQITK